MVSQSGVLEFTDVEMTEAWYAILVEGKRPRRGAFGAGTFRSGAGCQMRYRLHGTNLLVGVMLGMRERLPLVGMAGGFPGATTEFVMEHADGTVEQIGGHDSGVLFVPGDTFEFRCASGAGYGDPVDRDPAAVARDVRLDRYGADDAREVYGVVLDASGEVDDDATGACRRELLAARLRSAEPALHAIVWSDVPAAARDDAAVFPLYPGVEQRGGVAVSERSGAPLAIAPDHWTDGCPVLEEVTHADGGLGVVRRAYLDPVTGHALFVDAVPAGEPRAFTTTPRRWTEWAPRA